MSGRHAGAHRDLGDLLDPVADEAGSPATTASAGGSTTRSGHSVVEVSGAELIDVTRLLDPEPEPDLDTPSSVTRPGGRRRRVLPEEEAGAAPASAEPATATPSPTSETPADSAAESPIGVGPDASDAAAQVDAPVAPTPSLGWSALSEAAAAIEAAEAAEAERVREAEQEREAAAAAAEKAAAEAARHSAAEDEMSAIRRSAAELTAVRLQLAERNVELRRLRAEYENHRRRTERDQERLTQEALYSAMEPVIDALDSIDRARQHAELDEGMRMVAVQLERSAEAKGLVRFGEPGDVFDPALHEAVQNLGARPDVTEPTCDVVLRSGYRIGERVLRAAEVVVVGPETPAAEAS